MSRSPLAAVLAVALCASGAALVGGLVSPAAAAPPPMSWSLAHDMAADPTDNPIPDSYGNPGVWSFLSGSGDDASTYQLLTALNTAGCGVSGFDIHQPTDDHNSTPLVGYNGSGQDVSCGTPYDPADAVVAHPAPDSDAIIAWTSPIDGTVSFSGAVKDDDPYGGDGISYSVLTGGNDLVDGVIDNGGAAAFSSAADVTVSQGQVVYLHIGRRGGYDYDSTRVDLTFTDTTASASTPPSLISSAPRKVLQGGTRVATLHGHGFDASTQVSLDDASGITLGTPTVVDAQTLKVQVAVAADAAETTRHWYVSDGSSAATTCAKCGLQVVLTPRVSSVSPSSVAVGGSYDLMLTGSSFRSDMVARFSGTGVAVTGVSVSDSSHATVSITVDSAAKKGLRNLLLRIPGKGKSVTNRALRLT